MNKFAAIINKTNFFYKLALEFTAVNSTAAPGTSQPIDQKQKDDLDLAMRYVDAIKQNIEAINKKYYPLISRDNKISGVISEISNYYQGIVAMQQQFQTNKNNEQFFNYMSNISSKVKDSLIRLYTSESIAAADPTAAQQLYSLAKQLNDSVAPFFKKLADNSKPTSTTTATAPEKTATTKVRIGENTFFVVNTNNPTEIKEIIENGSNRPPKDDESTYFTNDPSRLLKVKDKMVLNPFDEGNQQILSEYFTPFSSSRKSDVEKSKVKELQTLLNNKLSQYKGYSKLPVTGNLLELTHKALAAAKVLLDLPPSSTDSQVFSNLNSL